MEDFLFRIFVQFSALQASFTVLYAHASLHCLPFTTFTALTVFSVSLNDINNCPFYIFCPFRNSNLRLSTGNALTTLTELSRSGHYGELGHDLLASTSYHRIVDATSYQSTQNVPFLQRTLSVNSLLHTNKAVPTKHNEMPHTKVFHFCPAP
jgi:hypothetical protein